MTPRVKFALVGLTVAGGLAALFASTKTAKAAPSTPSQPSQPSTQWPADNMPWMMYSATTLSRQRIYNQLAVQNGLDRYPQITEDGILGPQSCTAFKDLAWLSGGQYDLPIACAGRV